jgi:hypothetical protein
MFKNLDQLIAMSFKSSNDVLNNLEHNVWQKIHDRSVDSKQSWYKNFMMSDLRFAPIAAAFLLLLTITTVALTGFSVEQISISQQTGLNVFSPNSPYLLATLF